MREYRAVFLVNGVLLLILGVAMLVPALLDAWAGHPDWQVFLAAAFLTGFVGAALAISCWGSGENLQLRQAFVLTTTVWVTTPAFGALPFVFADLDLSYTDAFFEAMSGITTTGSTVISDLEYAPPGILIWRALLQWMGGIGIIVTAVVILPLLQVGGMQLFRIESSDASEKVLPRTAQIAGAISIIYLSLSMICAFVYWAAGMPAFEAAAHSMSTIATGGFSTSDLSIGVYDSALIDYTAVVFMIIGSLPFLLYFQTLRGQPLALWQDSQVRWFFSILVAAVGCMVLYQVGENGLPIDKAIRYTVFNVTSILTGTGYTTDDYGQWGGFAVVMFFFVMFIGGCAGSTSCGIKIFRFQVLYAAARSQIESADAAVTVARKQADVAEAAIAARQASAKASQTNIANLQIKAPIAGQVVNRQVNVGSYVAPGSQLMALVPEDMWITANFKETQLEAMRVGQPVSIKIDAFPNVEFKGYVASFQQGAGQAFAILPPQNATGNFVKVVQRVPVRIVFDVKNGPDPRKYPIGPGMSAVPTVKVR